MADPMTLDLTDVLRLEVETDPPPGTLVNELPNGRGLLGGYGWETPVPGSLLTGEISPATLYELGLRYISAAAASNYFRTEPFPVTPGRYVRARWRLTYYGYPEVRARIEWLDASRTQIGATGYTLCQALDTVYQTAASLAPSNTVYARLSFELSRSGPAYPMTEAGHRLGLRDVVVCKASTSGALANLPANPTTVWTNILGTAHQITIEREALNAGTLSAEILDAALDPATATLLRPGRRVRLLVEPPPIEGEPARDDEPLFTGEIDKADVAYDLRRAIERPNDARYSRITLTAADPGQRLAAASRPEGVAKIDDLPAVLEGCGVPWLINNSRAQIPSAAAVTRNESATAVDQVAITRDSERGYAFVDRRGTMQAWNVLPEAGVNLVRDPGFALGVPTVNAWIPGGNTIFWASTDLGVPTMRLDSRGLGPMMSTRHRVDLTGSSRRAYTFSARLRPAGTVRAVRTFVDWFNESGVLIASSGHTTAPVNELAGAWRTYTKNVTAPATAVLAELVVEIYYDVAQSATNIPNGEQHHLDDVTLTPTGDPPTLDENVYTDMVAGFGLGEVINEVSITLLRVNLATGETVEVPYGPYRNQDSVNKWGLRSATFTVHGLPDTAAAMSDYAAAVLAANATPAVRADEVTFPIRSTADLSTDRALVDLYQQRKVVNASKGLSDVLRVTKISHQITAGGEVSKDRWITTLGFADSTSVAAPQVTPPVQALPLVVTDSGDQNATGPFDGTVRFTRIEGLVFPTGGMRRASGFSSAFLETGVVVPASLRPAAVTTGPAGEAFTGHQYQYQIRETDGALLVRMASGSGLFMAMNMPPWPPA